MIIIITLFWCVITLTRTDTAVWVMVSQRIHTQPHSDGFFRLKPIIGLDKNATPLRQRKALQLGVFWRGGGRLFAARARTVGVTIPSRVSTQPRSASYLVANEIFA